MSEQPNKSRVYWVDWIRIFATYMVILHHNSILFDYNIAHIVIARSKLFTRLLRFLDLWGMQIFCFISGYAFSLQLAKNKTNCLQLFTSKFKRLIVPIYLSSIFFVSTADYVNLLYQSKATLAEFPNYFLDAFLLKRFRISHLWFLVVIFLFLMINFPYLSWVKSKTNSWIKLGFTLAFVTASCGVFWYFQLPYAYYIGIIGTYIPSMVFFFLKLDSNGLLINLQIICTQIIMNMTMNPLPSQVRTSEPGHAFLILLSLNLFFQSGYYMHHFIEKMSFLAPLVEYIFFVSTPFIIYLTPQQEVGYVYDDKNYIDLTERFLFHLGSWYWILFTCWSCYQKLNFETIGYRFLGATAFSLYLSHLSFIYLFGYICTLFHLNDIISFFFVNILTVLSGYLFYLISMSNPVTRFLFFGETNFGQNQETCLIIPE